MHKCPGVNDRKQSTTDREKIRRYTESHLEKPHGRQNSAESRLKRNIAIGPPPSIDVDVVLSFYTRDL